jgi:hypothetical protein
MIEFRLSRHPRGRSRSDRKSFNVPHAKPDPLEAVVVHIVQPGAILLRGPCCTAFESTTCSACHPSKVPKTARIMREELFGSVAMINPIHSLA